MFLLLGGAFLAGIITVMAPCVLPLLPIIIGGSIAGDHKDKKRPLIIAVSLAISLILFTLLLKATTVFINVPPQVFTIVSGVIIIVIGFLTLFPSAYEMVIIKLGIQTRSQSLMGAGLKNKNKYIGPIITGAALGPVFSSCSPVYAYILATVLPVNFAQAMLYITSYVIGLSVMLLLIGLIGQRFITKIKWATNPKGWFQRTVAILFIIVGFLVLTGFDKKLQTYISEHTPFNFDKLSSQLIPASNRESQNSVLNVKAYDAPEFTGLDNWINSSPLTKADLKGKVVLIDFWTYSCINCIRTEPYLKAWYDLYKNDNFVVIGIHAPEFSFEKVPANVEKAARDAGLTYPIALDNDFKTWNAYQNQYWPTSYLLDKEGKVRRVHGGEGEYKETEDAIRLLLAEQGGTVPDKRFVEGDTKVPVSNKETAETYLGTKRASNYSGLPRLTQGDNTYTPIADLESNHWTLGGDWTVSSETITAKAQSTLTFKVSAKDVYLVAGPSDGKQITVLLDGKPISQTNSAGSDIKDSKVTINGAQLYRLVSQPHFVEGAVIQLQVPSGVALNVFTFGS
jgi:cytochrome c biogenesis protein CcdA/thiol-disulfide isomerase/thioredoxin